MADLSLSNYLLRLLFLFLYFSGVYNTEQCYEQSLCLCKLNDNRFIDISRLATKNEPYLSTTKNSENITYYFDPCDRDFDVHQLGPINTTSQQTGGCDKTTSLCAYNSSSNTTASLGSFEHRTFSSGLPTQLSFTDNSNVTILVVCVVEDIDLFQKIEQKQGQYIFALMSSRVCPQYSHAGLSTGSKLLIMFGTAFAIYLLGGALVLHFLRGARGKEVIPNVDFWTSLPGLVKDGFVFILSGCHPTSISTSEAYDRI